MPGPYLNSGLFSGPASQNDLIGPAEEIGIWRYDAGRIVRYVKSGSLIPRFESVRVDGTVSTAALIGHQVVQTDGQTNMFFGVADSHTFANLSYGWVTIYGPATARVDTTVIPNSALGPNSQTGVLTIRNTSHFNAVAVALQSGLSAGSAVFITVL